MDKKRSRIAVIMDSLATEHNREYYRGIKSFLQDESADAVFFQAGILGDNGAKFEYQNLSAASLVNYKNFDGVIFIADNQLRYYSSDRLFSFLKSFDSLPLVCLGYPFPSLSSVISSARQGLTQLMDSLVKTHRSRKFIIIGEDDNSFEMSERLQIVKDYLKANDIKDYRLCLLKGADDTSRMMETFSSLDKKEDIFGYDAVVALKDKLAIKFLDYAISCGKSIPEDILLAGCDDLEQSALMNPSLSTVNNSLYEQGYEAASSLMDIINKKSFEKFKVLDSHAVLRQSTKDCYEFNATGIKGGSYLNNALDWNMKNQQLRQLTAFLSDTQSDLDMDELKDCIVNELKNFDIKTAAVLLFKQPVKTDSFEYLALPYSSYVYAYFDDENKKSIIKKLKKDITYNPREVFIPDGIFDSYDDLYVIMLYRGAVIYGYLVFRPGKFDIIIYNVMAKILSNNIAFACKITESKAESEDLLRKYTVANVISVTDELTGLLNRRGFVDLGQKSIDSCLHDKGSGMVLYGDIDGLKHINDSYGHASGDRAIQAEADILQKTFRSTDLIGRLGGDEFGIIAPGLTIARLKDIRNKIDSQCHQWNKRSKEPFTLSISIGYTIYDSNTKNTDIYSLMDKADASLYEEKSVKHALRNNKDI